MTETACDFLRRPRQGHPALAAPVPAQPRVHVRRRRRAGAGDRRQHGDLLGRQRGPAQDAAVPRSRPAGRVPAGERQRQRRRGRLAGQVPALALAEHRRPGRLGLPQQRHELRRRRRARAVQGQPGVGRLLQAVRGARHPRPRILGGRGFTQRAQGRAGQRTPVAAALPDRPEHAGPLDFAERRAVHRHRHRRAVVRRQRVRAESGCLGALPAGSRRRRSGSLLPGRGQAEGGRLGRSGHRAAEGVRRGIQAEVPARPERQGLVRRPQPERADGRGRADHALRAARRGRPGAADRLRQRRQPAAGPRHRPPTRDRDPLGDRRRPRPHHRAAAHRERAALGDRRRLRARPRRRRHARAAGREHRQPAARRRGRQRRRPRLAGAAVHDRRVARHRAALRPDPGAAGLAVGPRPDHQGERQPLRHRRPPQSHARRSSWSPKWPWRWSC